MTTSRSNRAWTVLLFLVLSMALLVAILVRNETSTDADYRLEDYVTVRVALSPEVRRLLREDWAVYDSVMYEPEHGYCLTKYTVRRTAEVDVQVDVHEVIRAIETNATPMSITLDCGGLPFLHTHPPSVCTKDDLGRFHCRRPLQYEDFCAPSSIDEATISGGWHRFGIVQCADTLFSVFTVVK